mgnify:CR=1 FL=1
MVTKQLIDPKSIVVVGGSDDIHKPGGAVLRNLQDGNFKGELYVVNPKMDEVQGVKSYKDVRDLPVVDCAILAIAAKYCPAAVEVLAKQKNTRAFIILSAGFHEENEEGAKLEKQIVDTIDSVGGALIGPNCIGVLTNHYSGVFTQPIPKLDPRGVDLISGSGATALFIMDNLDMGSNPNSLPQMQMRGVSSFPIEETGIQLKGNYQNNPNQPLFILDGFNTTVERVMDMDMNRIESVTLLKDAAAKAIYGSKAANGVVVITTKRVTGTQQLVTYTGSVDI